MELTESKSEFISRVKNTNIYNRDRVSMNLFGVLEEVVV